MPLGGAGIRLGWAMSSTPFPAILVCTHCWRPKRAREAISDTYEAFIVTLWKASTDRGASEIHSCRDTAKNPCASCTAV